MNTIVPLGLLFYTTNALSNKENIGVPFYNSQISHQLFDSPYANSDDVGMIPNTFEGIVVTSKELSDTKIVGAYLTKWSGADSDTPQEFTKLNDDKGFYILGGVYGGLENLKLKAWLYALLDSAILGYFETHYKLKVNEVQVTLAGQYSVQDCENGECSTIYGVSLEATYEPFGMTTTLAYNEVDGKAADNFFGGGPFFTSWEHITVVNGGDNANALLVGASFDLGVVGIENLAFGISHLSVERQALQAINELDITLDYNYNKNLNL
jgi:hypothetical protein